MAKKKSADIGAGAGSVAGPAAVPAPVPARRRTSYEFCGPIGTAFLTFFLPPLVYLFAYVCNDISGCPAPIVVSSLSSIFSSSAPKPTFSAAPSFSLDSFKDQVGWRGVSGLISRDAFLFTLGYYLVNLLLWAVLPAEERYGTVLRSGGRLKYRLNSFYSLLTILAVAGAGTFAQGTDFFLWTFLWDNFVQVLTSNLIIAVFLATYTYVRSFEIRTGATTAAVPAAARPNGLRELAAGGVTGNIMYDWFIGRELNPRISIPFIGEVDIKHFMELRPGLMLWVLLDLTFAVRQYRNYGTLTASMILCTGFQILYVLDGLYMEPAVLTTIDITTDGFGFMLSFGDLVWVPFVYSLQARYLAVHPVQLGVLPTLAIAAIGSLGYYIFRASNNEKNRFRTNPQDPKVAHLQVMKTRSGSRLLVSGWWGTARHINYLGDWLLSWAYSLPTGLAGYAIVHAGVVGGGTARGLVTEGFQGWGMGVTYFYMIYFAVLLIHRERRDEEKCRAKYGADWDEYCRRVRWRIVPYVY